MSHLTKMVVLTVLFSSLMLVNKMVSSSTPAVQKSASAVESLKPQTTVATIEKNHNPNLSFLKENQKKPGVLTLPSGLQYKIVQEGSGNPPGPTDFVTVNYRGTLIDGSEFDSSYAHQGPITFAVNAVIPGWSEALQLMKPGSKWTLYVPSNLAYGAQGAGRKIGPNATLIFDIELVSVKPPLSDLEESLSDFEDED